MLPVHETDVIPNHRRRVLILSQLRVVMLYGASKPYSTSLKSTNECPQCQRCWQDRRTFATACTRMEGRPTRLLEDVGFMCNAVRRGGAGAHTWRTHCLARSSSRIPDVGFLADGEYSCWSVSELRGTQSRVHGLKCRGYEALWAQAAHSPRVAGSGGSPTALRPSYCGVRLGPMSPAPLRRRIGTRWAKGRTGTSFRSTEATRRTR